MNKKWLLAPLLLVVALPVLANTWPPDKTKVLTESDLADRNQQPSDPDYPGNWYHWGFLPSGVLSNPNFRQAEAALGSGMSADRAWQLSIGNPRATVAIADSGFRWGERDLVTRWRLNKGELPAPEDATGQTCTSCVDPHDVNADGAFTVVDFTDCKKGESPTVDRVVDKRLTSRADKGDVNGNGILDPQDLIAVFSDKKDDDGNGYADDICGWDFLWDDNDVFDDVENGGDGYSHGTNMAGKAAAEGNNGMGNIGVCPDCTVLPLRPGDSFVAEGSRLAEAIVYATDNGAAVLSESLGALDQNPLLRAALDYAYAKGMPVMASAADETSFHHNLPAAMEHVLAVHAIVFDGSSHDAKNTTTFLNFNNCSNWGGHIFLSIPAKPCASEATSLSGGHATLLKAYAMELNLNPPLSAAETYALMYLHADDIDVPESKVDPTKFPSQPGFEASFGYGRNNVFKSLEALKLGRVPPEVDIESPRWYETVDPGKPLEIRAAVAAKRATSFDYEVQLAPGLNPADGEFKVVARVAGSDAPKSGVLASADVSGLLADTQSAPVDPHDFAATVRVRAVAHYGGAVGDVNGEARKTFFVHRDPMLHAAFPLWLGASGEGSPKLADLDGDGRDELVVGTAAGEVHAFTASGEELPGFPVHTAARREHTTHALAPAFKSGALKPDAYYEAIEATVAVGDLNGDSRPEIVASTMAGAVYAWDNGGTLLPGFPVRISDAGLGCFAPSVTGCRAAGIVEAGNTTTMHEVERGFFASPVLYDLDNDGRREIVQAGLDGMLHVYTADGAELRGFPVLLTDPAGGNENQGQHVLKIQGRILSTPAVGDVDGDGLPEIFLGTNETYENDSGARAYLVKSTGAPTPARSAEAYLPGWPVKLNGLRTSILPFMGRGVPTSPIMIDSDNDGRLDLLSIQTIAAPGQFFHPDGTLAMTVNNADYGDKSNSQDSPGFIAVSSGTVADLDGDGLPDYFNGLVGLNVLAGAAGGKRAHFDHLLAAWAIGRQLKSDKSLVAENPSYVSEAPFIRGFPQVVDDHQFLANYVVADVDGDGRNELLGGSGGYTLHGFNADGARPGGWPKFTGGWLIGTPAVGDLDGDGKLDVVATTREGWAFAWRTTATSAQKLGWESFHHDAMNTGNTLTPIAERKGVKALDLGPVPWLWKGLEPHAEGCGCQSSGGALLLAALAALVLLRRRAAR